MRNCVGAAACLSGLGSHTGRPRNKLSNASSSGLKRVMFSILFSCETSNQSAVDDCASVADWVVYGVDTANCYVCEPKYFMKQTRDISGPWAHARLTVLASLSSPGLASIALDRREGKSECGNASRNL